MGCCFSDPKPRRTGPSGLEPGPGFYPGEQQHMLRTFQRLEAQGLPVPTHYANGQPIRRPEKILRRKELAAAMAADPEYWNTPRNPNGSPVDTNGMRQWQSMNRPVNIEPEYKRRVNAGGRVVYEGNYGLFGRWREELHRP